MSVRVPLGEAGGSSPSTLFPPPSRPDLAAPGPKRLSFPHLATETRLGENRNLSERCGCTRVPAREGFKLGGARPCGHWLKELGVGHCNWFEKWGLS